MEEELVLVLKLGGQSRPRRGCMVYVAPNGLELSCPAEAGKLSLIVAHAGGPGAPPYAPARRVSFSELLARNRSGALESGRTPRTPGRRHLKG
jgi:hypothetical protein